MSFLTDSIRKKDIFGKPQEAQHISTQQNETLL